MLIYQNIKKAALATAALSGLPKLMQLGELPHASVLLFHRFFENSPYRRAGIDELRRRLEWLASVYTPISLDEFERGLSSSTLVDRSVLVTIDDAHRDIIDAAEVFQEFGIPITVFVCAGWAATASKGEGSDLLARTCSMIEWYAGEDFEISLRGRSYFVSEKTKAQNIEDIAGIASLTATELIDICDPIDRRNAGQDIDCCTWSELSQLASDKVAMGAHLVTHINLATASPWRRKFEIEESRRVLASFFGECSAFAYSYGTDDAHDPETKHYLSESGYSSAFLTHSGFVTPLSDKFLYPRIALPGEPMSDREFRARVLGAGVFFRSVRDMWRKFTPRYR